VRGPRFHLGRAWLALFVFVPLAYNPVSRWQWEPDKAALVLALTGLLVGDALRQGVSLGSLRSRPWRAPGFWIGLYLLVRLLSMATSVAPHWSLWGDPAWRNGMWLVAAGAALFVLARRTLAQPPRHERAVAAILIASAVVSGCGVAQYVVVNYFAGQSLPRVASTLAHPNLLAAYLAMVIPLTATRLLAATRRVWAGALLALQGTCLVLTYSRAGWLAAMAGLAVMGIAWLWASGQRRAAGLLVAAGLAGLAVLFVLSLLPPLPGSAPHMLQNLTNMFRWKGATAQIRLLGWWATLDAIAERPWLGYGPATFGIVLEWFLPPKLAPFGGAAALGGRPHDVFLEVAVESGLLGLTCYLAMLGAILLSLVKPMRAGESDRRWIQAAVLGSLAANLTTYLFSFESAATLVLFWSLAGMAQRRPPRSDRRPRRSVCWLGWAISVASVLLAVWLVAADVLAFVGESLLAPRDLWRESVSVLGVVSDLSPTPEAFLAVQGDAYGDWAEMEQDEALWQHGAAIYDRLTGQRPGVAGYWRSYGWFLRRYHLAGRDPDVARRAVDAYTKAIRLSPNDPDLWLDRGLMWLDVGESGEALADFRQADLLLGGYTRYYGAMSIYALAQGDAEAAAEWQTRALEAQRDWDDWVWRR
jgi:O-antigen ligase